MLKQIGQEFKSVKFVNENDEVVATAKYHSKACHYVVTVAGKKYLTHTIGTLKNVKEYVNQVA
ncbi:MAG: hypothetical protein ACRC32_04490 [Chroococcidiopsis sp.]